VPQPGKPVVGAERVYRAERCLLCGRCVAACEHGALSIVGIVCAWMSPAASMPENCAATATIFWQLFHHCITRDG